MEKFMLCTMLFVMKGFVHVNGINLNLGSECLSQAAGNSTSNTIYKANLRTLFESLVKDSPLQGAFLNTSIGTNGLNQVYGLAWCRADVSPNACLKCLNESISVALKVCPESKDLGMWSSLCSVRFSSESFFGELWNTSSSSSYGDNGLDEASVFAKGFAMMESLGRSVSNKRPLMFDTGVVDVGSYRKRYGLGQCSRDLSKYDCANCLEELLMTYRTYVLNRTGWEMLSVSCGLWYDDAPLHDDDLESTPTPIRSGGGERWCKGDVILAFVAILLFHWMIIYLFSCSSV